MDDHVDDLIKEFALADDVAALVAEEGGANDDADYHDIGDSASR